MPIGSWDPAAESKSHAADLTPSTLARLIAYSANEQLNTLEQKISGNDSQTLSSLIQVDHSAWLAATDQYDDDDLKHLIRFFVVAENLPGWEALDKSPVIPLAKALRKRGLKLDKIFLQWLRENSSNRFLPYGPL